MKYTSCIRVRGVPILPPLMTEQVRSEMNYYKQLALSVEEKLSRQQLIPQDSPDPIKNSKTSIRTEETLTDDETTLTKSTDLNKYLINPSDTSETSSEPSKSQIPTSLDIIPITLDYHPLKKSKSSSSIQNPSGEPKKLVRQGSYTLDTPSPLLLAHIELNRPQYVPTSTKRDLQSSENQQKPNWNLTNCRSVWTFENSIKKKEQKSGNGSLDSLNTQVSRDNNKKTLRGILERSKSSTEVKNRNFHENNSLSTKKEQKSDKRQESNRNIINSRDKKENFDFNGEKKIQNGEMKINNGNSEEKNGNFYFVDKKLGGSLGDLINSSNGPDERMTRSLDINDFDPGTSDRLLGVFREIQRTHDRQMTDLIERQQREQVFMQQAFEKQQLMLLEQIDRTFPGISILELVKRVGASERRRGEWKNEEFSSSFDSDGSISLNFGVNGSPEGKGGRGGVSRQLFPLEKEARRGPGYDQRHIRAATVINAYARGFLVRRMMKTEQIIALKNTYREALHCMLKLTIDAPLDLPELNFHKRLQLQCDAASMNIVELFSQSPRKRMKIIAHDRDIKKARIEHPTSARSSISFATQRTLARKKLKELGIFQLPETSQSTSRTRCQTWTSHNRDKKSPGIVYRGIKRSTSAGAVRKPWR